MLMFCLISGSVFVTGFKFNKEVKFLVIQTWSVHNWRFPLATKRIFKGYNTVYTLVLKKWLNKSFHKITDASSKLEGLATKFLNGTSRISSYDQYGGSG